MKICKRITIGAINSVRKGFKDVKSRRKVARILGIAREATLKVSENMKDSYRFDGEFKAINETGVEYVSAVCYLPEPAQGLLHAALQNERGDADRGNPVEFGFDFFVVPEPESVLGYVFETEALMDHKPSNALAELEARVAAPALTHETKREDQAHEVRPAAKKGK